MSEPELWYPHAIRDPCDPALWGTYSDTGEPKCCLHSTESNLGAYSPWPANPIRDRRYYGHTSWPTATLAYDSRRDWRIYQHIPANRAARALANRAGGVETNRDNVTQIEICVRAQEIRILPDTAYHELARWLAWEHHARGLPLVSTVTWVPYPSSYGDKPQRLTGAKWDAYAGVLGHQHAPENSHGDPGELDIARLLQLAHLYAYPDDEEDVMTPEQETKLLAAIGAVPGQVWRTTPSVGIKQPDMRRVAEATYDKAGDIQAPVLTGIAADVAAVKAAATKAPVPFGDVTEEAIHDALDRAVDVAALARIVEHGGRALSALLTRPPVLPPSEA